MSEIYIQFNKRRLKHSQTAGRQKGRNKIIIYLRYVAQIALNPFYRQLYKRSHLDKADSIMNELIRTTTCEIICLAAKQESSFICPKGAPHLKIESINFTPLELLCPPLKFTSMSNRWLQ